MMDHVIIRLYAGETILPIAFWQTGPAWSVQRYHSETDMWEKVKALFFQGRRESNES